MASAMDVRNKLIDQLMAIEDTGFLQALSAIINHAHIESETVALTDEQKLMLAMSDDDITAGRTVDQQTLYEREQRWLDGK